MLSLKVTKSGDGETKELSFSKDELELGISLGRLSACGITLNDSSVSRKHGEFKISNGTIYYMDCGSKAGSVIDDKAINADHPVEITEGDSIQLGPFQLLVLAIEGEIDTEEEALELTVLAGPRPENYQAVACVPTEKRHYWQGKIGVTCVNVINETPDVKTFVFSASPEMLFHYQAGQFFTLHLKIDGNPVNRSYTISSTPSRPHSLTCTVKRVPGVNGHAQGLVSNWLHDNLHVGDSIEVSGPFGVFSNFVYPSNKLCLISGGSGITPMLSMTRWICDTNAKIDIVFVHIAKSESDLIAREELEYLAQRYPNLTLIFSLTRDDSNSRWSGYRGRFSSALIALAIPDLSSRRVFVCGPSLFMSSVKDIVNDYGFPMDRYHEESFGGPNSVPEKAEVNEESRPAFGLKAALGRLSGQSAKQAGTNKDPLNTVQKAADKIQVIGSSKITFKKSNKVIESDGQSILETAEAGGLDLPFGCRAGMCGACKQKKISGEIIAEDYDDNILSDDDRREGYILCCIAKASGELCIDV